MAEYRSKLVGLFEKRIHSKSSQVKGKGGTGLGGVDPWENHRQPSPTARTGSTSPVPRSPNVDILTFNENGDVLNLLY